jgi:hypothetical protein
MEGLFYLERDLLYSAEFKFILLLNYSSVTSLILVFLVFQEAIDWLYLNPSLLASQTDLFLYIRSRSNMDDFSIANFKDSLLQLLLTPFSEVKIAAMRFRQSVGVAEYKATLAFGPEQPHFLTAGKAPLPIFLQLFNLWLYLLRYL